MTAAAPEVSNYSYCLDRINGIVSTWVRPSGHVVTIKPTHHSPLCGRDDHSSLFATSSWTKGTHKDITCPECLRLYTIYQLTGDWEHLP